jgi:hypothetical protein
MAPRGAQTPRINEALWPLAVSVGDLWEDPDNLREHSGDSIAALVASLERFGQQKPIVALKDGKVIAGNGMFRAAKTLGWTRIAVSYYESEADYQAFALADNRLQELSGWNREALAREVGTLADADVDLALHVGFTNTEVDKMIQSLSGDAPPAREPSIPEDGLPPTGLVYATSLELASEAQQDLWFRFMDFLVQQFPDIPSPGARLAAYVHSL